MSRVFAPAVEDRYEYNIYYNPVKCGLELIDSIETGGSYEFCTTLALQDIATKAVFLAQDSGCSCPTPFEDFRSTGDLIPYTDANQVRRLVDEHHGTYRPALSTVVQTFIRRIETVLKGEPAFTPDSEPKTLADVHEELEEAMIAAGTAYLAQYRKDELESLREFDEFVADERIDEYNDAPLVNFRWPTRLAIEDAIGNKGGV